MNVVHAHNFKLKIEQEKNAKIQQKERLNKSEEKTVQNTTSPSKQQLKVVVQFTTVDSQLDRDTFRYLTSLIVYML